MQDLRKYARMRIEAKFHISWIDEQGQTRTGVANLVDISEGGFAIELREAPRKDSRIRFVCNRLKLTGLGQIRSCTRRGYCYRIGVEFVEGSKWTRPAGNEWDWGFSHA
jgi:hypothetical protein